MKQKYAKKIVKYFDSIVERTIFKLVDKTNNFFSKNSKVSNFNKVLIAFISLLFVYLFYLSIPTLYNKTWLQNTVEKKLVEDFKVNFSTSSNISYYILPTPHFLIKDAKIFKDKIENTNSLAEIKNLKVFVSQKNFFDKEKIYINEVVIDDANFSLLKNDFKLLNDISNKKFSNKEIKIINSNIFFKNNSNETISIIRISKAFLFFDSLKLLNLFKMNGEVFNIPFVFDLNKEINSSQNKNINIKANKLKLKIFNSSNKSSKNSTNGSNLISIRNHKIFTEYNIKKNIINFRSVNSRIKNSKIDYKGQLSFNPFDLKLDVDLENYRLSKLLDVDSIMSEFIKTKLLFNENISVSSSITTKSEVKEEIFDSSKINLNIINGEINFDKTKFINEKIGSLELENSKLFFEGNQLILRSDILINIQDHDKLFSFLQTSKKSRRPIKNIFINLDYNFLNNQIEFNNIRIDNVKAGDEVLIIVDEFNDIINNNLNKSRRIMNKLLTAHAG